MEGRGFVEHPERRDIEAGLDEELGGRAGQHRHQADVDDLGGVVADDVDAEEFLVVLAEEEFQDCLLYTSRCV